MTDVSLAVAKCSKTERFSGSAQARFSDHSSFFQFALNKRRGCYLSSLAANAAASPSTARDNVISAV